MGKSVIVFAVELVLSEIEKRSITRITLRGLVYTSMCSCSSMSGTISLQVLLVREDHGQPSSIHEVNEETLPRFSPRIASTAGEIKCRITYVLLGESTPQVA